MEGVYTHNECLPARATNQGVWQFCRSLLPPPNPRTPGSRERQHVAALKPRWSWRELFRPGSSPPAYARIAITRDTGRRAPAAAIVGGESDESSGSQPIHVPWGAVIECNRD